MRFEVGCGETVAAGCGREVSGSLEGRQGNGLDALFYSLLWRRWVCLDAGWQASVALVIHQGSILLFAV